jgi:hypothetical protein
MPFSKLFQSFAIPHILPTGPGRKSALVEGLRGVRSRIGLRDSDTLRTLLGLLAKGNFSPWASRDLFSSR